MMAIKKKSKRKCHTLIQECLDEMTRVSSSLTRSLGKQ